MFLLPRFPENAGTKVQMTILKWFHIHDAVLHKNGYIGQTAMFIFFLSHEWYENIERLWVVFFSGTKAIIGLSSIPEHHLQSGIWK